MGMEKVFRIAFDASPEQVGLLLQGDDRDARLAAAWAMCAKGNWGRHLPNVWQRRSALICLVLGHQRLALAVLAELDPSPQVRGDAILHLSRLVRGSCVEVNALLERLSFSDEDHNVRLMAVEVLAEQIEAVRLLPLLERWANDSAPAVRKVAAQRMLATQLPYIPPPEQPSNNEAMEVLSSYGFTKYNVRWREVPQKLLEAPIDVLAYLVPRLAPDCDAPPQFWLTLAGESLRLAKRYPTALGRLAREVRQLALAAHPLSEEEGELVTYARALLEGRAESRWIDYELRRAPRGLWEQLFSPSLSDLQRLYLGLAILDASYDPDPPLGLGAHAHISTLLDLWCPRP